MSYILIVEDDQHIVRVVKAYLEKEGYRTDVANDGLTGLEKALRRSPTLIVLDWMLPGLDGLEFMKRLRQEQSTPIIMLTAKTDELDKVLGLELGADDYLTKPFSPRELVARIKAVLRRGQPQDDAASSISLGRFQLDVSKRQASYSDKLIDLTTLEFDLLHTFMAHPGRVYSRGELLDRVWGTDFTGVDRVVDVHISNLRHKIERVTKQEVIQAVRGVGYRVSEHIV